MGCREMGRGESPASVPRSTLTLPSLYTTVHHWRLTYEAISRLHSSRLSEAAHERPRDHDILPVARRVV